MSIASAEKLDSRFIRLARLCYPVTVLGPGKRMGIWVSGCHKDCSGCISPELRDPASGELCSLEQIRQLINRMDERPDGFTVSGGEPFEQPEALADLLEFLNDFTRDIIIFTGWTLEELKEQKDPNIDRCLMACSVLIDGPFIKPLQGQSIGLRGSSNQNIHIFRDRSRYAHLQSQTCQLQTFVYDDRFLTIGIPEREDEDEH